MKFIIQIVLCSVIGGLAIYINCGNDGSGTLRSCQSNPNIMIEKITKGNKIESYKLSLHSQDTWWAPNDKWIECKNLCKACESLPGETKDSKSIHVAIYVYRARL